MEGYKTLIGIFISFLGAIGLGEIISKDEAFAAFDLGAQLIGLIIAVYGRIVARKQLL